MAIKYVNIFQSKALHNFFQIVIFGLKTNHLATLMQRPFLVSFLSASGAHFFHHEIPIRLMMAGLGERATSERKLASKTVDKTKLTSAPNVDNVHSL
jgi:hypothetical protein